MAGPHLSNHSTNPPWQQVRGVIQPGHGVASGTAVDSPYPHSTIAMQRPYFKTLGLDLGDYFNGTLNISIHPHTYQWLAPKMTFEHVRWTDLHPPETFSFADCRVHVQGQSYPSLIYYPHPETKKRNFQNSSILEVIAPLIPGLSDGCPVILDYHPWELQIRSDRETGIA